MAAHQFSRTIGDILVARGFISSDALQSASEQATEDGVRIEKVLAATEQISSEQLALATAEYLHMPPVKLSHFTLSSALLDAIPHNIIVERMVLPIAKVGKSLTVALGDPFDLMTVEDLATTTGLTISPVVAPEQEVLSIIEAITSASQEGLDMEELMRDDSEV
jgi:type IV pilus assembly protein PilB